MNLRKFHTDSNFTEDQDGSSDFSHRYRKINKAACSGAERRERMDRRYGADAQIGRKIRVRFGSKYVYVPKSMDRRSGIDRRRSA